MSSCVPFRFGILLRTPQPLPKWQRISYPLNNVVWISTGVCLLLVAFTYHLLKR